MLLGKGTENRLGKCCASDSSWWIGYSFFEKQFVTYRVPWQRPEDQKHVHITPQQQMCTRRFGGCSNPDLASFHPRTQPTTSNRRTRALVKIYFVSANIFWTNFRIFIKALAMISSINRGGKKGKIFRGTREVDRQGWTTVWRNPHRTKQRTCRSGHWCEPLSSASRFPSANS